ncbi:glucosamine-6-phosphate deaminase [Deinococcus metalli]|uniref:Glucosamine-6-phosphate deaminase n=1 Tax=Deinococcus metalli TaxID=1141878 RepID=A0A7W8KE22_9DEIO|nr:glucosamine-6-phosphate deaminase [Deinococcus metalli]MBB5376472.1 glucosamine-6-phosphate deaminase [Deinococcus metalli]
MTPGVTVHVVPDAPALADAAAEWLAQRIARTPALTVLVATGQTPMGMYAQLAERVRAGTLDCSGVTAVQLDEYAGLPEGDPRSLRAWMLRSFVTPLGVQTVVPLLDPAAFTGRLAALGGLDVAVLGLGPNGHVGFNEPPSGPDAPTREVALTPESLRSNAAYWSGLTVPTRAVTAGMDVILGARETLLLVSGAHKCAILSEALDGPETPLVPASFLRRTALTVLADRDARP